MGRAGTGVKRKTHSSIEISFQYQGQRCRETIDLEPSPANIERVKKFRADIVRAIQNGTFDYAATFPNSKTRTRRGVPTGDLPQLPPNFLTVEKYFTDWLAGYNSQVKASTYEGYRKIVDHLIIPEFGPMPLEHWKRRDVKAWLEKYPCSNKRLANIQSVIRKALADAVDDEHLTANFMTDWTYSRQEQVKDEDDDEVDPFTTEEQDAIIAKCVPTMANQTRFFLWTGLRTSELIALNWKDIDFVRGYVRVRKAITTAAKGMPEKPKTKSGNREVKLLGPALQALRDQKALTMLKGEAVFLNPGTGVRWTGDQQIRDAWVRILKLAGVRYRRPYQTRHTYASMMLSAGEHPMWVAKQMGHADWTMIARVYGRWMPTADVNAGGKAEALFGGGCNTDQPIQTTAALN